MKANMQGIKRIGRYLIAVVVFALFFSFNSAADTGTENAYDFNTAIKSFPESYRPYLEELHKKYPQWIFLPFETGLDWYESIDAQYGDEALVQHSITADILKSHDADDYNPSNGTFVYKDGGFVQASELAVEYFMDPRNFLNEDGIFQFEMLSFDEIFTVEAIESILKGSFMSQKKISYLDEKGNTVNTDQTYAEVIYRAGYTYDINPCYLASKILNEVGTDGSYSVWGNHATYPGIYNFYNIGATDGVNAVTRGLAWANGGADGKQKTYSRPWTSPEKSIMGGAEFLSSSYIAVGQFTGYLQRFNVNPDSLHKVHTHQFMTNLTGALSQGYTSYASYVKQGIIDNPFVFSIPVFDNMPVSSEQDSIVAVDSKIQYGTVNSNGVNIRTGPSTTYARLQSDNGVNILLNKGTSVKIQSKHFIDSDYYARILQYPIWYKIRFEYNAVTYTGYILADYVDIESVTNVGKGTYDLGLFKSSKDVGGRLMTSDPSICKITDSDTVEFLSVGEVYVSIYNSRGLCDRIRFRVNENIEAYSVDKITVSPDLNSIKVTLPTAEVAERYGFYLKSSDGEFIKGGDITNNVYTFKNLSENSQYTIYCRYVGSYCYDNGPLKAINVVTKERIEPDAPKNLSVSDATVKGFTLNWESEGADGYRIYRYRPEKGSYEVFKDVKTNSVSVNDLSPAYSCAFRIKAYRIVEGKRVYSDYSPLFWALTPPEKVSGLSYSDVTHDKITVSWSPVQKSDSYKVYLKSKPEDILVYEGTETFYKFSDAVPFTEYSFYVVSTVSERNKYAESIPSDILTVKTKGDVVNGFAAEDITSSSYRILWSSMKNAIGYNIYRLVGGEYKMVASVADNFCEFTDLESSNKDFYKVSALYDLNGTVHEGELSAEFSVATLPDKVTGVSGVEYQDKVELSWTPVKGADCYNVYLQENGKYVLKKTVKENRYTLEGLKDATKHNVRIRAYIRATLGTQKGKITTYSFYTKPKTVTGITASSVTDTTLVLSWNASSETVNRYYVYISERSNGGFKLKKTTSQTGIKLTGLESGKTCHFRVVPAVIKDGSIFLKGDTSQTCTVVTKPSKPTNLRAKNISKNSFTLYWDKVTNATYYRVYRYDTATKKYVLIDSVYETELKISSLNSGKKYYYKVRPIKRENGVYAYGYYSDLFTVTTKK